MVVIVTSIGCQVIVYAGGLMSGGVLIRKCNVFVRGVGSGGVASGKLCASEG